MGHQPWHILTFGFGTGLIKFAPGTWGTLPGILLYLIMFALPWPVYIGTTLILTAAGIGFCQQAGQALGVADHPAIVLDEMIGYLWAMLFVPFEWHWVVGGFILFRLFDALKPWPISIIDRRLKNGMGVMLDDVAAGLAACAVMQVLIAYFT